MKERKDFW